MAYEWSQIQGQLLADQAYNTTPPANFAIDSAFVYETSGDAWFVRFIAPVSQTTDTLILHVYCESEVGNPTDVRAALYNGPATADNPTLPENGGSPLGTSGAVDFSGVGATWVTLTISSVSLVAGQTYYLVVDNRTGTPASHYPTLGYRAYGGQSNLIGLKALWEGGYTTNGFTGAVTVGSRQAPAVVKFADGTIIGCPYPVSATTASNTDDGGSRFTLAEDVVVSGVIFLGKGNNDLTGFEINKASGGDNIVTTALDRYARATAGATRFTPATLTGGLAYDCVLTKAGTTTFTVAYMGETTGNLPADVLACRVSGAALVTGGTPGSYTADTTRIYPMALILDNNPAQAGGGRRSRVRAHNV